MANEILHAVSLQRDLYEGGRYATGVHHIIRRYVNAALYTHDKTVEKALTKDVLKHVTRQLYGEAQQVGYNSAKPILDKLANEGKLPALGWRKKDALRKAAERLQKGRLIAHKEVMRAELGAAFSNLRSETRVEIVKAARDGRKKKDVIRAWVKADREGLESQGQALRRLDKASEDMAKAEKSLSLKPDDEKRRERVAEARKELRKAKSSAYSRRTRLERFETAIRAGIRDNLRRVSYDAQEAAFRRKGFAGATQYMWVAVNGSNACPSCNAMHGETHALDAWEGRKPGNGTTYCGESCCCQLVPSAFTKGNPGLLNPLKRES